MLNMYTVTVDCCNDSMFYAYYTIVWTKHFERTFKFSSELICVLVQIQK